MLRSIHFRGGLAGLLVTVFLLASCTSPKVETSPSDVPNPEPRYSIHDYPHLEGQPLDQEPIGTTIRVITDPAELQAIRKRYVGNHAVSRHYQLSQGRPEAMTDAKWALRSGRYHFVIKAIDNLNPYMVRSGTPIDPEITDLVIKLLDQENMRDQAIRSLPLVAPERAPAIIKELLQADSLSKFDIGIAVSTLGEIADDLESIHLVAKYLEPTANNLGNHEETKLYLLNGKTVYALLDMYERATDTNRQVIESYLVPMADSSALGLDHEFAFLKQLTENPQPRHLSFFEQRVDSGSYLGDRALIGIAKLKGKAAQPLVRKCYGTLYRDAYTAIPYAWSGDASGGIAALREAYIQYDPENRQIGEFVKIAEQLGGPDVAEKFLRSLPASEEKEKMIRTFPLVYRPIDRNHPYRLASDRLLAFGLLETAIPDSVLQAMVSSESYASESNFSRYYWPETYRQISFLSKNSHELPRPYDDLILNEFVPMAGGKLDALECYLAWDRDSRGDVHEQVWMIFQGRGYTFRPAYNGNDYDHETVRKALNLLLKDAGFPQRYIYFYQNVISLGYVFMPPQHAVEALSLLHEETDSVDGKSVVRFE